MSVLPKTSAIPPKLLLLILACLMAVTSLSNDIYLPAMPIMQQELQGNVEFTLTGFLIGFTIGQLIWGAISDRIGRKIPLFIGMVLFIIGSVGCALSTTLDTLVFWRVFQALGACTAPMLARAIVRDLYEQTQAVQMLSSLITIMAIAPIIGPLLGGQIIQYGSWHGVFWLLAGIGVVLLLSLFLLPETHPKQTRTQGSLWHTFANYGSLLKNKTFMRYTLCVTFYYVGAFAFIVGSPKVYIDYFGVSPQHYGWLFGLNIVGLMAVSNLNRKLAQRYSVDTLLRFSTSVAGLAGLMLAVTSYLQIGGLWGVVIPVFFFFAMNGVVASCATAGALQPIPEMAGAGSALIGSLQYGSGIISSVILAFFHDNTAWTMSWIIAVFIGLSVIMAFLNNNKIA